ncbi:MAG TPA: B12-binding domain-containing protein, partial [Firmicutes bacterium]|nr:B12-binding domain-containing protein [Bacillota bacterium]
MIENVKQAILTGKLKKIEGIVQETLDEGVSAGDILNAMIATMDDVGDKFQRNEIFVPEMLV